MALLRYFKPSQKANTNNAQEIPDIDPDILIDEAVSIVFVYR